MRICVTLGCASPMVPGASYVLETLLGILGAPFTFAGDERGPCLRLHYGPGGDRADVVIPAQAKAPWRNVNPGLARLEKDGLPIIHRGDVPDRLLIKDGARLELGFDIVAATLWLLSRQEEIDTHIRDPLGCFPAHKSWSTQNNLIETPLVNLYARLLGQALKRAAAQRGWPWLTLSPWPHKYKYAICLAHDVDQVFYYNLDGGRRLLTYSLRRGHWRGVWRGLGFTTRGMWGKLLGKRENPSWNFERIMDLEQNYGFRSTFYFVALISSGNRDPAYDTSDPPLANTIARLQKEGWQVGVHGSFDSYLDGHQLARERTRLESVATNPVKGIRQHYLRLAVPQTFRAQVQAGFIYDSSLGYSEMPGFRAGMASPFYIFDAEQERPLPLLELPLTVMDGTLFWDLGYDQAAAIQHTLALLDVTRRVGGLATLLWHQRVADQRRYPGWWAAYAALLEHLKSEGQGWVAPAADVAAWWQARQAVHLVESLAQEEQFSWIYRANATLTGPSFYVWAGRGRQVSLSPAKGNIEHVQDDLYHLQLDTLTAGDEFKVIVS